MRRAQIAVLVLALGAGGTAALLVTRSEQPAAPPPPPAPQVATVDILVAKTDIEIGRRLNADQLQWQPWPITAVSSEYFRAADNPGAINQIAGSITRASFISGEPILKAKLIRADGAGYMAALIRPGMRAISTDISPEAGVGGFILPNDRVDVILTRLEKSHGEDAFHSETILTNVRVLAIDQTVEEKNGQRVVIGKIATLELAAQQAETLALARRLGSISLMLRGLRELEAGADEASARGGKLDRAESVSVVRFGRSATAILR
jgi:pilus assembly protein CpaB